MRDFSAKRKLRKRKGNRDIYIKENQNVNSKLFKAG